MDQFDRAMNDLERDLEKMPRMEQLRRFVEWERANNPERTHIAEWALRRIAYLEAQPPAASVTDAMVCVWSEDEDGNWDTGCGNMFVLTDGTPYDNEMGFCCYCGHKLDQITQETAAQENPNG